MSAALLTLTGFTSTPNDGATAWMAANWAVPDVKAASRRTEARVTPGAICLSSSSHFPLIPYSKLINPVALPPGRARFSMKPPPTGSATCTNTIGTSRVACSNGAKVEVPGARRTSGRSASNSAAYLRDSGVARAPAKVDRHVASDGPAQLLQALQKNSVTSLGLRIVREQVHEHTDAPHPAGLLRPRRQWPGGSRAAE